MSDEIVFKEGVHKIGKPCKKCGGCIKYVSCRDCVICRKKHRKQQKEENKDKGLRFIGDTCKKCGCGIRYVSNGRCVLCEKERTKQRNQIRKKENKNKTYYEGSPCKKCGNCIRYVSNSNCVLCQNEGKRQWNKNNPDYQKEWEKNNSDKVRVIKQRRRARKNNAEGDFTDHEWLGLCNQYDNKCLSCGEQKPLEADHIVPLNKGGTNWISNIQPLCKSCNCSKGTKTIDYRPDPTLINPAPATS